MCRSQNLSPIPDCYWHTFRHSNTAKQFDLNPRFTLAKLLVAENCRCLHRQIPFLLIYNSLVCRHRHVDIGHAALQGWGNFLANLLTKVSYFLTNQFILTNLSLGLMYRSFPVYRSDHLSSTLWEKIGEIPDQTIVCYCARIPAARYARA